jgi:hypothetical protein
LNLIIPKRMFDSLCFNVIAAFTWNTNSRNAEMFKRVLLPLVADLSAMISLLNPARVHRFSSSFVLYEKAS